MKDSIDRQAAIIQLSHNKIGNDDCDVIIQRDIETIKQLPPAQSEISYIISETLHECGIYGEEATIKLIGTLKRIGRDDLIPPCVR